MLPARELPGTPHLMVPGSQPVPSNAGAADKVRLYARPQGTALSDERWCATYFRLAMGFGEHQGKLAWVHTHGSDFLGGAAAAGSLVLCDDRGKITTLDAKTGAVVAEADLGEPLRACVASVEVARPASPGEAKPLARQLADAVTTDDQQLVVAQKLLLRELTALEDETATRTLIDLAVDPRTSPDLLPDARAALATRRNGADAMQAALARHYDYLHDVLRAPPVEPLVQALGAMKATGAAPLLASHLLDPADTLDDVKQAGARARRARRPAELPRAPAVLGDVPRAGDRRRGGGGGGRRGRGAPPAGRHRGRGARVARRPDRPVHQRTARGARRGDAAARRARRPEARAEAQDP